MTEDKAIGETYLPLLRDTQLYLKAVIEQKVPDTVLALGWEEFYRVYDDLIRRFVTAQGVPESDVNDCVQEVWSEVVARLTEFNRPQHRPGLRAWLYTLVRSKATDRKARRAAESLNQARMAGEEPHQLCADPAALYERKWQTALLESVISELRQQMSETNYQILRMRLLEDRDVKDVALELNLKPEQVRYRHHRVMRKLRTQLAFYAGEPLGEANR